MVSLFPVNTEWKTGLLGLQRYYREMHAADASRPMQFPREMADLKRRKALMKDQVRSRVVTFRLSEEEYDALKLACGAEQDTLSAVARRTVLGWAEAVSEQPKVEKRLTDLDEKLDTLLGMLYRDRQADAKVS
jgi:hypothetical protein